MGEGPMMPPRAGGWRVPEILVMRFALPLLAFAALIPAAHAQPAEKRFNGPGWYCGGTYEIRLDWNDRATLQPPVVDMSRELLRIGKHKIEITSGPGEAGGKPVRKIGAAELRVVTQGKRVTYILDDGQPFPVQISSPDFRSYDSDGWFFGRFQYERDDVKSVVCLEPAK